MRILIVAALGLILVHYVRPVLDTLAVLAGGQRTQMMTFEMESSVQATCAIALRWAVGAAAVIPVACGSPDLGSDGQGASSEMDSGQDSRVTYVEYQEAPRDTLFLDEPLLTLGRNGDERFQFFRIRSVGALPDGRIVVADGGSSELRYYTPGGDFIQAVGGEGEGPGEFQSLGSVRYLRGDTVLVDDNRLMRATLFAGDARLIETVNYGMQVTPLQEGQGICVSRGYFLGLFDMRYVAFWTDGCLDPQGREGLRGVSAELMVLDLESSDARSLGRFEVGQALETNSDVPVERFLPVPHSPSIGSRALPGGVVSTADDDKLIRVYDPRDGLRVEIHADVPRFVMTGTRRARAVEDLAPMIPEWARSSVTAAMPDSLSPFAGVTPGADQVWVRRTPPESRERNYWTGYRITGERLGVITLPRSVELHYVGGGRAYAVARDDVEVERVEVFAVPPF